VPGIVEVGGALGFGATGFAGGGAGVGSGGKTTCFSPNTRSSSA
jgi:hypothetical protein